MSFALATLLLNGIAQAGMPHRDCRFPMVFEGAAVNVVVLPYRYADGDDFTLRTIGNRLSLLVKLDVLSHILDYGSVGAVQMEMPAGVSIDDRSCMPDTVLQRLLGPKMGAVTPLVHGRGLVLVWGLIYQRENDIFVQTFARFLRREVDETVTFSAGASTFSAKPSSQVLAFTPQKFTQQQLEQIEDSYRRADFVRPKPDDNVPGEQLPEYVAKCSGSGCDQDSQLHAGFYVEEKKGEWIRIQFMDPIKGQQKEGWIHSAGGIHGTPLEEILPELNFIEGCAGYLRQRVAESEHTAGTSPALAVTQLKSFVHASDSQPNNLTNAVALQLAGIVETLDPASGQSAAADFESARQLIPYDPNAITLAVSSQVRQEWTQTGRCLQTAVKAERLSAAGALSTDQASIQNLSSLYALLLKIPGPVAADDLSKEEVRKRIETVQKVAAR
jgi:hypothetical protein